ncbi:MAG: undecaprenyldiphospho-muramoylpentapeptide beta-N-acetylglucosaminyltransferase [Thermoleophilum sp.]|nr:undecaprenyldiphospho-muramoylpentapeptide beta-N-acetylglucosaminyltransferase [Thermoleophilum sp.]
MKAPPAGARLRRPRAAGARQQGPRPANVRPLVAIAAGGTGGHVVPALAIAGALRERGATVVFFGGDRAEAELVPDAGYELVRLAVRGLDRRNPLRAASAVWLAGRATVRARRELARRGARAVVCCGGYVGVPVGLAARTLRLPLFVTEADSHLGVANRLLARFAERAFLAFPIAGASGRRFEVVGRPLPPELVRGDRDELRRAARARFGIPLQAVCVLVFGGSLGARSINHATVAAFAERPLPDGVHVLHVAGRRDYREIAERLARAGNPSAYHLVDFVKPFAPALACADLVVARSGGSVLEVAALGLPMVLVPYPHAAQDHQRANARFVAEHGAAIVIDDAELDGDRLRDTVLELVADRERRRAMASSARSLARPDAARRIAAAVLAACGVPAGA